MTRRGIILISTLFGVFALSFGVLGVRALTLGPDQSRPTTTEITARQMAADQLERQINAARSDVPPALPEVPGVVPAGATPVAAQSRPAPPQQYQGEEYQEEEYEEDEGEEYEEEHGDDEHDEHEEGDDDDD